MSNANASFFLILMLTFVWIPAAAAQTRVDLAVESVQVNTPRLSKNQNVVITATIRNNGSEAAENVDLELRIFQNGKRVKTITNIPVLSNLPRSGSGQAIPISVGALAQGAYEAAVIVDPDNGILETDEANNKKKVTFHVTELLA